MSVFNSVRKDIAEYLSVNYGIALDSIAPESTLTDVGVDSLGVLAIATLLENRYGLSLEDRGVGEVRTFDDLMRLIRAKSGEPV